MTDHPDSNVLADRLAARRRRRDAEDFAYFTAVARRVPREVIEAVCEAVAEAVRDKSTEPLMRLPPEYRDRLLAAWETGVFRRDADVVPLKRP